MRRAHTTPEQRELADFIKFMRKSVQWSQAELARHLEPEDKKEAARLQWCIHSYEALKNSPRNPREFERKMRDVVKTEAKRLREEEKDAYLIF